MVIMGVAIGNRLFFFSLKLGIDSAIDWHGFKLEAEIVEQISK